MDSWLMSLIAIVVAFIAIVVTLISFRGKADQGEVIKVQKELERAEQENKRLREADELRVRTDLLARIELADNTLRLANQGDVSELRAGIEQLKASNLKLGNENVIQAGSLVNLLKDVEACKRDLTQAFNEKITLMGRLLNLPQEKLDSIISITNIARDVNAGADLVVGDKTGKP